MDSKDSIIILEERKIVFIRIRKILAIHRFGKISFFLLSVRRERWKGRDESRGGSARTAEISVVDLWAGPVVSIAVHGWRTNAEQHQLAQYETRRR